MMIPEMYLRNILQPPHIIKIPELIVSLAILLLHTTSNCYSFHDELDNTGNPVLLTISKLAALVFCAFFFICIILIVGVLFGEKCPIVNGLVSFCGCLLYFSASVALLTGNYNINETMQKRGNFCTNVFNALGIQSLIMSALYLLDIMWSIFVARQHSGYITIPIHPLISPTESTTNILRTQQSTFSFCNRLSE